MTTNFPSFYQPQLVGQIYKPNIEDAVRDGRKAGWKPATSDGRNGKKIALLVVDAQIDFVHSDGCLPVPGAIDDMKRVIELIYHEGHRISTIVPTVDTHYPFMIFFPTWWSDSSGQPPAPYTVISGADISAGKWRAVIDPAWSHAYVEKLEKAGKHSLMIWPFHCMDGTIGITLVPPLAEAIAFHAAARSSQPVIVHKGHIPQTEFYSPLRPEVDVPNVAGGTINTPILSILANHDEIWVVGEAKSHCVLMAMETLVDYFEKTQKDVLKRIKFLMDCTSSVAHPAIDFEKIATDRLNAMEKQHGINLIKSQDLYT